MMRSSEKVRQSSAGGMMVVSPSSDPAEQRQEVHESVGQIPPVAVLFDIGGTVALRELLAVGAQDHGQMREQRHLGAERLVDEHLARGVGEMVVAAG